MTSPFNWNTGEPSIFLKAPQHKNQFNGVDDARSAMQTRLEPRPTYLTSGSVYLAQPKVARKPRKSRAKVK
jgi:hypothetical protein